MLDKKGMWIDVIAKAALKDKKLQVFHETLRRYHESHSRYDFKLIDDVELVREMVSGIVAALDASARMRVYSKDGPVPPPVRRVERLRIFGHGSANLVALSPLSVTLDDATRKPGEKVKILDADLPKVIQLREGQEQTLQKTSKGELKPAGTKTVYELTNELSLKRLKGMFTTNAWVELHSCQVANQTGERLLQELARLWNVNVLASRDKQYPGKGLEGRIVVAKPTGQLEERTGAPLPKEEMPWYQFWSMSPSAPDAAFRGSSITPSVTARGTVSRRQRILGPTEKA